jgi:hypothetical protein
MKLIQVSPMGNMGNRMIQYLVALSLAQRVPGARIVQIHLPEWGIGIAPFEGTAPRTEIVTTPRVDLERLAACLNDGSLECVDIRTYGQHIDNLLAPPAYRGLFHAPSVPQAAGSPDELVCNIRQGDILDAHHPDYVLIPPDFYAELIATTGLRPVFCGQLEATPYLETLKKRFPAARYEPRRHRRFRAVARLAQYRALDQHLQLAGRLAVGRHAHLPARARHVPSLTGSFG